MKTKISLVALATALSLGSAFAADLPSHKAPPYIPPPPPPPMWTGFYVGLNAGYGFGTDNDVYNTGYAVYDKLANKGGNAGPITVFGGTAAANTGYSSLNQSGFVGGGQIGYNYQFYQNFLVGIEADIDGTGIRGSAGYTGASATSSLFRSRSWSRNCGYQGEGTCAGVANRLYDRTAVGGGTVNTNIDYIGTVRGRVGWLATPTLLVFGTGGLAYGGVNASSTDALTAGNSWIRSGNWSNSWLGTSGSWNNAKSALLSTTAATGYYSNTLVGWTAGGGVEWMFMPGWSAKVEALYYDLGSENFNSGPIAVYNANGSLMAVNVVNHSVKYDGVMARAGVNYHFNWFAPAPVLAKY